MRFPLYAHLGMKGTVLSPQAYGEEMKMDMSTYSAVARQTRIEKE